MNNTLTGKLTSRGNLNGNVNTIVFAHNYNDLTNKPQINNVTLQGNKTASELGLATPSDITVTSVNEQTGDVILSGSDIDYSVGMSVNAKIDDLESQIVDSGVQTVNGMTGNVTLTGANINYSVGVSLNSKIDAVEGEIPIINYPVTSVNGETGAVVLDGSDIAYDSENTINEKINAVESEIPTVDYPVTSVNEKTGDVELTGADIPLGSDFSDPTSTAGSVGDLSTLTTTDKSSLVGAVNEVNGDKADKEWTLVDEKQGSTAIALPATWNELYVICRYGTSGGAQPQLTTGVVIPILAGRSLIIGGGSLFAQVDLNAQGTQIQMNYFEINSTNFTSTSYFTVYYR